MPYQELVLDQFVVSMIDLNLASPQQSLRIFICVGICFVFLVAVLLFRVSCILYDCMQDDLGLSHCINHDSCNVLLAGKAML